MELLLRGRRVTYRVVGEGPPALFIPAFPLDSRQWIGVEQLLAPRARVVSIDLPGFGGSDPLPEAETTIAAYADAVDAVAAAVAPGAQWVLGGCSMGGYVVFECVRRGTIARRGLVLSDTRAVSDTADQREGRVRFIAKARAEGVGAVVDAQLPRMLTDSCDPTIRAEVESIMRSAPLAGVLGALNALLTRPDSVATLSQIKEPVLAIVGEHDPVSPPAEMEAMASKLSRVSFVRIQRASHFANLERPQAFHRALLDWWTSLPVS
ncbi:MAG: alpha/beta fold hydrolase [Planctomycetes bacterium]|nr:alpha/beta fold hydrolase [Planctomycetota bacterium]